MSKISQFSSRWCDSSAKLAGVLVLVVMHIIKREYYSEPASGSWEEPRTAANFCIRLFGWLLMLVLICISLIVVFLWLTVTINVFVSLQRLPLVYITPVWSIPILWLLVPFFAHYILISFQNIHNFYRGGKH